MASYLKCICRQTGAGNMNIQRDTRLKLNFTSLSNIHIQNGHRLALTTLSVKNNHFGNTPNILN